MQQGPLRHVVADVPVAIAAHGTHAVDGFVAAIATAEDELPPRLGENFWLEIRRELRTEKLCGEGARPRAVAPGLRLGPSRGLLVRGALAFGAILLAVSVSGPYSASRERSARRNARSTRARLRSSTTPSSAV